MKPRLFPVKDVPMPMSISADKGKGSGGASSLQG